MLARAPMLLSLRPIGRRATQLARLSGRHKSARRHRAIARRATAVPGSKRSPTWKLSPTPRRRGGLGARRPESLAETTSARHGELGGRGGAAHFNELSQPEQEALEAALRQQRLGDAWAMLSAPADGAMRLAGATGDRNGAPPTLLCRPPAPRHVGPCRNGSCAACRASQAQIGANKTQHRPKPSLARPLFGS